MAQIHQLNCGTNTKNTGFGGCPVDWKLIAGALLFDSPISIEESQLANLQAYLQGLAANPVKSQRCFPIANFLNQTDNSEEAVYQTFSDGSRAIVRDGVYDWSFQFTKGGFCLLQALKTHNGNGSEYALFYDKNNNILGTNINGKLSAIPMQVFYAESWKMNTGSATAVYKCRFIFSSQYVNEQAEYTSAGFDPSTILGLQDIKFIVNGFNAATGLANISIITECGGSNLYAAYSADFVASLFLATNADNGSSIPVTSVTPIASNQTFSVQLNHASGNWPSDGNVFLTLVATNLLAAAGLVGFEAEGAYLEVTAS